MAAQRVYICIVDEKVDNGKLKAAATAAGDGIFDWWNINQSAQSGDIVLFYSVDPEQAFTTTGIVARPARIRTDTDSQFDGQYCADISRPRLLARPVGRTELEAKFPEWGFPRRPGKQQVAADMVTPLLSLLGIEETADSAKRQATAELAKPISGDQPYQRQARAALPILVRQAQNRQSIFYSVLAAELGMPNPRNLNYVLGSVGQSIVNLSQEWGEEVPPIQCLVVNKETGLPGEGVGWFILDKDEFKNLPLAERRHIVNAALHRIYTYRRWNEVLEALGLKPLETDFTPLVEAVRHFRGGPESEAHQALKSYVATHPEIIGLPASSVGQIESQLLSGDCLDVSFERKKLWVAVEVKSAISPEADINRGIFQCVKYLAVMEAMLRATSRPPNARAVLVLEGTLPPKSVELKNMLGVEVIEGVKPQ